MTISTVRKFGVGVASIAMVAAMASPALADEIRPPAPRYDISQLRLAGADRVETAIELAKHVFDSSHPADVVYLAGAAGEVDAAAAGALTDGPILLVKADGSSNEKVAEAVAGFGVDKVVALGGSKVVPDGVLKDIAKKAGDISTDRIDGKDRYETSVNIAKQWSKTNRGALPSRVVLANGVSLVDALTAGALNDPILLVNQDGSIPDVVRAYIKQVKPQAFTAVGGTKVVPESTVLDAQYTALASTAFTSDDSLSNIERKLADYANKIGPGGALKVNADTANDQSTIAKSLDEAAWATISTKVSELTAAVKAYRAHLVETSGEDGVDLDGTTDGKQKRWNIDLLAKHKTESGTGYDIQAKLRALATALNSYYALTTGLDFAQDADIKAALDIDGGGNVSVKKDDLYKKVLKDLVEKNTKAIKAYNDSDTDGDGVGDATKLDGADVMVAKKFILDGASARDLTQDYSAKLVDEVIGYYAKAATSQYQAAQGTYAYLVQQKRNIVDQLQGKSYLRLWGQDRYATSAAIADWLYQERGAEEWGSKAAYVVNGNAFADAVVAGTITDGPILLVNPNGSISADVNKELVRGAKKQGGPLQVWAIGGDKVITNSTLQTANNIALVGEPNSANAVSITNSLTTLSGATLTGNNIVTHAQVKVNGVNYTGTVSNLAISGESGHKPEVAPGSDGKIDITITPGTTKFGNYTITFLADGKAQAVNYNYTLGNTGRTVPDTSGQADHLLYANVLPASPSYASGTPHVVKTDGTYDSSASTNLAINGQNVKNDTNNTGENSVIAVILADNPVVVFSAGAHADS